MPTEREWLEARGIRPRKHLGQNFLLDLNVTREIVRRASWPAGAPVCEIGPGGGALTSALLASDHPVTAVEIDPGLVLLLRARFEAELAAGRLTLREADFLEFPLEDPAASEGPAKRLWLAGNLPYGVTTPVLLKAMTHSRILAGAVIMVQREYGERILARAGEDSYGSLSVWVAAHATTRSLIRVGRSAFWPRPGVESIVLELLFPEPPPYAGDPAALERVLRAAFGQRRKMMENALAHGLELDKRRARRLLEEAGCDPGARAETLGLERFAALAEGWGRLRDA